MYFIEHIRQNYKHSMIHSTKIIWKHLLLYNLYEAFFLRKIICILLNKISHVDKFVLSRL